MRAIVLVKRAVDVALVRAAKALGGETIAISVGAEADALPVLAAARGAGATRLVRLWDPGLETTDYLGVSYTLAAAIRAIGDPTATATAIVAGDRGRSVVGPAVSERLGVPLLGQILTIEERDGKLVAKRRGRDVVRSYAAAPPALVCLLLDGEATPASAADAGDVESWTLSKVGLSAAELSYRKHFATKPAKGPTPKARKFEDVAALAAQLRAEGLLRGAKS
ncbi:MAG: electron transfer flavoprotein subunit beta [bacterium]|nr:electron transfer flavoprotein subunit beta [bacterium]